MSEHRESWGTRIGFILAAAGFSIGLGNIWRFPYLVGTYGGGAFVLLYVAMCILIGFPLLCAEFAIGRKAKLTPVLALRKLQGDKPTVWSLIGWVGAIACVILMSYYTVIIGWMLRYACLAAVGTFTGVAPADTKGIFDTFMQNPVQLAFFTLIADLALALTLSRGVKAGVEKVCSFLLPLLGIMIVILCVRSLTMTPQVEGGKTVGEAMKWYLAPDFSKITPKAALAALGQSFFSIGIGIATGVVYGSYLSDDSNIPQDAASIITMDTGFALLAGVVIFPVLFCYGMDVGSGPSLLLQTMPVIFGKMTGGVFWGTMFFILVAIAGFTSGIGYYEAPIACFAEFFNVPRKKMTWIVIGGTYILGIPSVLAYNYLSNVAIKGLNIADFADYLSGNIMMPVDALLVALYIAFVWKFEGYQKEVNSGVDGAVCIPGWFKYLYYVLPFVLAYILATGV